MKAKLEQELLRLEEGLPQMLQQREQLTQQILRIEGALMTLKAMLADEVKEKDVEVNGSQAEG
jgi:hypothetical protein